MTTINLKDYYPWYLTNEYIEVTLNQFTGRYMLHILARFTSFIDEQIGNPNKFADYVNRRIKNPYDIEHIIPDDYESYKDIFASEDDLHQWRAKLGNLILLTKDKNRSYL